MNWQNFIADFEDPNEVPAEWLIERIRKWRNKELRESDHRILEDTPLNASGKLAWRNYRKDLRDLPQQNADPRLWVFPEPPAV